MRPREDGFAAVTELEVRLLTLITDSSRERDAGNAACKLVREIFTNIRHGHHESANGAQQALRSQIANLQVKPQMRAQTQRAFDNALEDIQDLVMTLPQGS